MEFVDQPINARIDDLAITFENTENYNPFMGDGIKKVWENDATAETFKGILLGEVEDEYDRITLEGQLDRAMEKYTRGAAVSALLTQSSEGWDISSAPGENQGEVDAILNVGIVGINAQTHMFDIFKVMNHKTKEFGVKYTVDFVIQSDADDYSERMILPKAAKDGSLKGALDPVKVDASKAVGVFTHIEDVAGKAWIKPGCTGNIMTESGLDKKFWALAEDIRIAEVRYIANVDLTNVVGFGGTDADAPIYKTLSVQARASRRTHNAPNISTYNVDVHSELPLWTDDATKDASGATAEDFFMAVIDRNLGEYRAGATLGRIVGFTWEIPVLNVSNLARTLEHGSETKTAAIVAGPRQSLSIALSHDNVMDEFQGNTDIVKLTTEKFAETVASVNDLDMEDMMIKAIDEAIANPEVLDSNQYLVSEALGAYVATGNIDATVSGPAGNRPWDWFEYGSKDTLKNILIASQTKTYFNKTTNLEFVFIGYEQHVNRFVSTEYFDDKATAAEGEFKFGFKKDTSYAYSDNFGRRVKFIGSTDERFLEFGGVEGNVYGLLRSNNPLKEPTAIYYAHDFRVMKARSQSRGNLDAIKFQMFDTWDILTLVGVKLNVNSPIDTYSPLIANSRKVVTAP